MNSSATSAGGALGLVREVERLPVGEDAVADLEHLGVGVAPVERDGDRVEGADDAARHALALEQRAHGLQAVALQRGLLELLRGGRGIMRCSSSRSMSPKRPERKSMTPSMLSRYSSRVT